MQNLRHFDALLNLIYDVLMIILNNGFRGVDGIPCHVLFAGGRNRDFALFQICAILNDHIGNS